MCNYIHPSTHPSSSTLSGAGSRGQLLEQGHPDFPLLGHFLQLYREDPEVFLVQPSNIVHIFFISNLNLVLSDKIYCIGLLTLAHSHKAQGSILLENIKSATRLHPFTLYTYDCVSHHSNLAD